eukprot:m.254341 g.254341  ORF g.254341 m.254341 type:complete len:532 (+) comp18900_c0_seq1:172-1767(+)
MPDRGRTVEMILMHPLCATPQHAVLLVRADALVAAEALAGRDGLEILLDLLGQLVARGNLDGVIAVAEAVVLVLAFQHVISHGPATVVPRCAEVDIEALRESLDLPLRIARVVADGAQHRRHGNLKKHIVLDEHIRPLHILGHERLRHVKHVRLPVQEWRRIAARAAVLFRAELLECRNDLGAVVVVVSPCSADLKLARALGLAHVEGIVPAPAKRCGIVARLQQDRVVVDEIIALVVWEPLVCNRHGVERVEAVVRQPVAQIAIAIRTGANKDRIEWGVVVVWENVLDDQLEAGGMALGDPVKVDHKQRVRDPRAALECQLVIRAGAGLRQRLRGDGVRRGQRRSDALAPALGDNLQQVLPPHRDGDLPIAQVPRLHRVAPRGLHDAGLDPHVRTRRRRRPGWQRKGCVCGGKRWKRVLQRGKVGEVVGNGGAVRGGPQPGGGQVCSERGRRVCERRGGGWAGPLLQERDEGLGARDGADLGLQILDGCGARVEGAGNDGGVVRDGRDVCVDLTRNTLCPVAAEHIGCMR